MRQMLMGGLLVMALGTAVGISQTNTQQTAMTKSELKQQEKTNKSQAKADKAQRKALNTKEQKKADRAQDKANRDASRVVPQ